MVFTMYNCDFGVKINGTPYDFEHVDSLTIEDPELTRLTRGSNGASKTGLIYKEGLKDPKKITVVIKDMSIDLKGVLDTAFNDKSRLEVYCINRDNGSSKIGRNCVLCQQPQQLSVDENPDSMNVSLVFETFDLSENFKE